MRRQATRLIIPAKKLLFSATRIDSGLGGSVKCLYFRGDAAVRGRPPDQLGKSRTRIPRGGDSLILECRLCSGTSYQKSKVCAASLKDDEMRVEFACAIIKRERI